MKTEYIENTENTENTDQPVDKLPTRKKRLEAKVTDEEYDKAAALAGGVRTLHE